MKRNTLDMCLQDYLFNKKKVGIIVYKCLLVSYKKYHSHSMILT